MIKVIPTHIINLTSRTERKIHIEKEFSYRDEFDVRIESAIRHEVGAIGLWETIKKIISNALREELEFVLICEDDHQFSVHYNWEHFKQCIGEAIEKKADILCGGPSWFEDAFPASENLFWVSKFSGLQFTVIFKKLYEKILNSYFNEQDASDYKISVLASNKYFVHPFISTQKEFGYSDVTSINHGSNRVEGLFAITEKNADILKNTYSFYRRIRHEAIHGSEVEFETITIPTYIINLPERTERLAHIINQFKGKREFETTIIEACKHNIGAVGLWQSIRKVIQLAIDNDDDVIIICEDDHEFAADYSKEFLLRNIIEAHEQGCKYLNCGTGKFGFVVPISPDRFWTNHCLSTQFIVLYRNFFQKILDELYDDTVAADLKLSEMTSHKMILYPFISTQHDFGYSDVTAVHNEQKNLVTNMFAAAKIRLEVLSKSVARLQIFQNSRTNGKTKNLQKYHVPLKLFIHTVFVLRENILFLEEWIQYHLLLGFDHFYLYDNSGSIGIDGSSKTTNKYNYNFHEITSHLSYEDIEARLQEILRKFTGHITLIKWEPKNEKGEIIYGQKESVTHYISNVSGNNLWTAFIDIDEFIYTKQPLKEFIQTLSSNFYADIVLFQKKFNDRFNNLQIPVTEITQCVEGIDTKYWSPKHILKNKNFDLSRILDSWSIHHLPLIPNTESYADRSLRQIRFNHYNVNEKQLKWMRKFYKSNIDFSLNGSCSELSAHYKELRNRFGTGTVKHMKS